MVDFPTEEDLSLNGFDGIFEYNQLVRNDPNLVSVAAERNPCFFGITGAMAAMLVKAILERFGILITWTFARQALEIRESAHFANAKNRPLSDKMGMLLEYICK